MNIIVAIMVLILLPQITLAKVRCPSTNAFAHYDSIILDAATKYAVDAALIHAVIKQESCYDRFALSPAGAEGLMQLMPATAKRFRVSNAFIAKQNIMAGTKYLAWLLKRFKGNIRFALAGYNAGEGKVDRYKGIPPYKETQNYVKKVIANYYTFKNYTEPKLLRIPRKKTQDKKKSHLKQHLIITKKRSKQVSKRIEKTTRNDTRHRIRSITLAKNASRHGYIRVRARTSQGGNNAS